MCGRDDAASVAETTTGRGPHAVDHAPGNGTERLVDPSDGRHRHAERCQGCETSGGCSLHASAVLRQSQRRPEDGTTTRPSCNLSSSYSEQPLVANHAATPPPQAGTTQDVSAVRGAHLGGRLLRGGAPTTGRPRETSDRHRRRQRIGQHQKFACLCRRNCRVGPRQNHSRDARDSGSRPGHDRVGDRSRGGGGLWAVTRTVQDAPFSRAP